VALPPRPRIPPVLLWPMLDVRAAPAARSPGRNPSNTYRLHQTSSAGRRGREPAETQKTTLPRPTFGSATFPLAGASELKGNREAEHEVVWWEIESPDPGPNARLLRALLGWEFRRAFDEPNSELGSRYWIVERAGDGIGGLQESWPAASAADARVR
jgi:hypothetical protein